MMKLFFWLAVILLLAVSGLYLIGRFAPNSGARGGKGTGPGAGQIVACTDDAKVCDDGSSVGRDPRKNCEFFPCPTAADGEDSGPRACTADAKLCADGSGVGRDGERFCAFDPCPGEGTVVGTVTLAPSCPYESTFDKPCPTATYDGDLRIAPATGGVLSSVQVYGGKFYATLAPGTYEISTGKVLPRCEGSFTVVAGQETTFAVSCESGVR